MKFLVATKETQGQRKNDFSHYRLLWWDKSIRDWQSTGSFGLAQAKEAIPDIFKYQGTDRIELVKIVEEFRPTKEKSEALNPIQSPAQ